MFRKAQYKIYLLEYICCFSSAVSLFFYPVILHIFFYTAITNTPTQISQQLGVTETPRSSGAVSLFLNKLFFWVKSDHR